MLPDIVCSLIWISTSVILVKGQGLLIAQNSTQGTKGGTVTLSCIQDPVGDPLVWLRNDVEVKNGTGKYVMDPTGSNLTVHEIGQRDVGLYVCRTPDKSQEAEVFLKSKPFIESVDKPSGLVEGETMQLTCRAWGWPPPHCQWFRESQEIDDGNEQERVSLAEVFFPASNLTVSNAQLTISKAKRSDQANYRCSAVVVEESGQSWIDAAVYVRVKDRLAAVWPAIGIVVILVLTVIIIVVVERKKSRNEAKMQPK